MVVSAVSLGRFERGAVCAAQNIITIINVFECEVSAVRFPL